jgi:hypothetical protein
MILLIRISFSHSGGYEEFYLLGYNAVQSVENQTTFRRNILLSSSEFVLCFLLVSCWAYSSTLKMEATCSSETSIDFERTTHQYIAQDKIPDPSFYHYYNQYAYICNISTFSPLFS